MKLKNKWRVYALKYPSKLTGEPEADNPKICGWYWLHRASNASLTIRVRGLENARFIARELNRAAAWPNGKELSHRASEAHANPKPQAQNCGDQ